MNSADTLWLPRPAPELTRLDGSVWLTRRENDELEPIHLRDMSAEHRWHVLQWLRTHAGLMQDHERRWLHGLFRRRLITLERFAERLDVLDATAPEVWIEDTPLVAHLHTLIRRDRRRCGR